LKTHVIIHVILIIGVMLCNSSCAVADSGAISRSAKQLAPGKIRQWKPIFRGVSISGARLSGNMSLEVNAVRINLWDPTIEFLVSPSNGEKPKDSDARSTSDFLKEYNCQIAINGSVFLPAAKSRLDPVDVLGLSLSRGDLYSQANKYHALLISRKGRAWIATPPFNLRGAYNGLSGYYSILQHGRNLGSMRARHPRTAVGISQDGRYLVLMTIDGRQPGYSNGATLAEAAAWLKKFGSYHGLNLDGGGSTTLVIEGVNGLPKLINRPAGATQRLVANHLGVYARKLGE